MLNVGLYKVSKSTANAEVSTFSEFSPKIFRLTSGILTTVHKWTPYLVVLLKLFIGEYEILQNKILQVPKSSQSTQNVTQTLIVTAVLVSRKCDYLEALQYKNIV